MSDLPEKMADRYSLSIKDVHVILSALRSDGYKQDDLYVCMELIDTDVKLSEVPYHLFFLLMHLINLFIRTKKAKE